jgi:hypothetical protein
MSSKRKIYNCPKLNFRVFQGSTIHGNTASESYEIYIPIYRDELRAMYLEDIKIDLIKHWTCVR